MGQVLLAPASAAPDLRQSRAVRWLALREVHVRRVDVLLGILVKRLSMRMFPPPIPLAQRDLRYEMRRISFCWWFWNEHSNCPLSVSMLN